MRNLITLLFVVAVFCSCEKQENGSDVLKNREKAEKNALERAYPDNGELVTFPNGAILSKVGETYVLDGDIILSQEQVEILRNPETRSGVLGNFAQYWPNGRVYYKFSAGFSNVSNVLSAIAHWEAHTPLRFYEATNQSKYILFVDDNYGSSSYLGMQSSMQPIYLYLYSSVGTAIHEIGHAIGLFHEQARSDRDQHLIINRNNIQPSMIHNFYTYVERNIPGYDIGEFDFESIMMYPSYTGFEINPSIPAMTKKNGAVFSYNRTALSPGDIYAVKAMYDPPISTVYARIEKKRIEYVNMSLGGYSWEEKDVAECYLSLYKDANYQTKYVSRYPVRINVTWMQGHTATPYSSTNVYYTESTSSVLVDAYTSSKYIGNDVYHRKYFMDYIEYIDERRPKHLSFTTTPIK